MNLLAARAFLVEIEMQIYLAAAINLLIAKQRNGPAGEDVHLTFLKPYKRFKSAAKIQDADVRS